MIFKPGFWMCPDNFIRKSYAGFHLALGNALLGRAPGAAGDGKASRAGKGSGAAKESLVDREDKRMSYFESLDLVREPFSNAPDPDLFYRSKKHMECLQQMEIAVRLRRGLNVVIGDVGTGKTTLCRQLIRVLGHDEKIETYLMLDPYFKDPLDFLRSLNHVFGIPEERIEGNIPRLKENLRAFLRERGEKEDRIITLIVDEGQKITGECLELLRELLNCETSSFKLLQIIIFAQKEFSPMLRDRPNLADRVNFRFDLEPLDYAETKRMIETRLALSTKDSRAPDYFSSAALWSIYRKSGGFPRKIVQLCHKSLLLMAAAGKMRAGFFTVFRAARGIGPLPWTVKRSLVWVGAFLWVILPVWAIWGGHSADFRQVMSNALDGRLFHYEAESSPSVQATVVVAEPVAETASALVEKSLVAPPQTPATAEDARQRALRLAGLADEPQPAPAVAAIRSSGASEMVAPGAKAERPDLAVQPAPAAMKRPDFSDAEFIEIVGTNPAEISHEDAAESGPSAVEVVELIAPKAADALDVSNGSALPAAQGMTSAPVEGRAGKTPPGVLGSVRLKKGWVISLRAAKVYGSGGARILSMLAGANPEIEDLDKVTPGELMNFPAIIAGRPPEGACLLRVGRADSLDMGFAYLAQASSNWPALTLFARFNPGEGLIFDVVMDMVFPDRASAGLAAAALPPDLASKAVIVDSFETDTVFYTELGEPESAPAAPQPEGRAVARNEIGKS